MASGKFSRAFSEFKWIPAGSVRLGEPQHGLKAVPVESGEVPVRPQGTPRMLEAIFFLRASGRRLGKVDPEHFQTTQVPKELP